MSTAGVTDTTHSIGVTVEIGGMSLEPSDAVVDVLELQGVRKWEPSVKRKPTFLKHEGVFGGASSISGAKNGRWRIHFLLTVLSKSGQQKLIMISSELEINLTLSVTVRAPVH